MRSEAWDRAVEAAARAISRCVATGEEPMDAALRAALPDLIEAVHQAADHGARAGTPLVSFHVDEFRAAAQRLAKGEA